MGSQTGLVSDLRPAARDQVKLRDRVLRANGITTTGSGSTVLLAWDMGGYAAGSITFVGDSNQVSIDGSNDLLAWGPLDTKLVGGGSVPISSGSFYIENSGVNSTFPTTTLNFNKQTKFVRVRAVGGSQSRNFALQVTLTQTPFFTTHPTRVAGPDNAWAYSSTPGGLATTTATDLIASTNTYHRRLLQQLELDNASTTTGTEVLITDGASTALWRGYLPPNGHKRLEFDPPLRATAGNAIKITLGTASVPVYANARGVTTLA